MSAPDGPRVVSIVYETLPTYRIPFYERLRESLARHDVELRLVHGDPDAEYARRANTGSLPWAHRIRNRRLPLGSRYLVWQPCLSLVRGSDLVVVEQASRLVVNYLLVPLQRLGGPRVAMWGHGRNLSDSVSPVGEAVKRVLSTRVHWWFAYTEGTASIVADLGFPRERISVVQNTIDSESLLAARDAVSPADLARLRSELSLRSPNVGIFSGSLYREKRPDFLVRAAEAVRARIPDFELIVLGAGPEQRVVEEAAARHHWIKYVGPRYGPSRATYFLLARVMVFPGVVGLNVVDAFVFETPLVTMELDNHGPEIAYLEHGRNGIKVERGASPERYAEAVAGVLTNPDLRSRLREGCRVAVRRYRLSTMVELFTDGVLAALERTPASADPRVRVTER